jgi:hypothetical protein
MGIAVATIVVLLAVSHITRHQRAVESLAAIADLRGRLRDASDLLTADLRGSSPVGDSILVALDTAIEFYSTIGTSTLCAGAGSRLTVPSDSLASGRLLSAWVALPESGDDALVLADAAPSGSQRWERAKVVAFSRIATRVGCPVSSGLLSPADVAGTRDAYEATLASAVPATVHRGSPVRFARRVRYSVYRGGDGKWYLGYRRCATACAAIQPVSGPYESRTGPPVGFRYFVASGARLTGSGPTNNVVRIEIVSRASYLRPLAIPGIVGARTGDSAVVAVALRNRR